MASFGGGGEILHLFYAIASTILVGWCIFTVATPGRRRDRTFTIALLMLYNLCLVFENVVLAFGNAVGEGDSLKTLSRIRICTRAIGCPVYLVVLARLADKARVRWPCVDKHNADPDACMTRENVGQGVFIASTVLGIVLFFIAIWRDLEENLVLYSNFGTLRYQPRHDGFGFDSHEIQEWLPALILLVWSLPQTILIQNKGGLKWYRTRHYAVISICETFLFLSRLVSAEYANAVGGAADLALLFTFMVYENKLVGEYREVKERREKIKTIQEDPKPGSTKSFGCGITSKLNMKYPLMEKSSSYHRRPGSTRSGSYPNLQDLDFEAELAKGDENVTKLLQKLQEENLDLRTKLASGQEVAMRQGVAMQRATTEGDKMAKTFVGTECPAQRIREEYEARQKADRDAASDGAGVDDTGEINIQLDEASPHKRDN